MAIFEAPITHEAVQYSNPESQYSMPEMANEYEDYSTPEAEYEGLLGNIVSGLSGLFGEGEDEISHEYHEYEDEASAYSTPEAEYEGLLGNIVSGLGGLFGEGEDEIGHEYHEYEDEASSSSAHSTSEAEYEGLLGNIVSGLSGLLGGGEIGHEYHEFEDETGEYEADMFFGKLKRAFGRVAKVVAPIAKRLAPIAARTLVGMIPGVGAIAGPLAGKLTAALVQEAEMEVAAMENHFLHTLAETGEAEHPEVHEALLSEVMAANAAEAHTEAEAEAAAGTIIPLSIRLMRAQRSVLPVTPALVQANVRLVKTLRRRGPAGREILRLLPEINALAVSILKRAARLQRLTSPFAVRAMAVATSRVMGDPRRVRRAIKRNITLRVAQATPQRGRLPLRQVPRRRRMYA